MSEILSPTPHSQRRRRSPSPCARTRPGLSALRRAGLPLFFFLEAGGHDPWMQNPLSKRSPPCVCRAREAMGGLREAWLKAAVRFFGSFLSRFSHLLTPSHPNPNPELNRASQRSTLLGSLRTSVSLPVLQRKHSSGHLRPRLMPITYKP